MSGRDLRFEVLNMMAKRDLALSEEYFAKLQSQEESEKESSKNTSQAKDDWLVPEAVSKRQQVASTLLKRPLSLTEDIRPSPSADEALDQMQNRIDRRPELQHRKDLSRARDG